MKEEKPSTTTDQYDAPIVQLELESARSHSKKRRLDAVDNVQEQPDAKKQKLIDLTDENVFAVPFYLRNSSEGIFGAFSNRHHPPGCFSLLQLLESKALNPHLLVNNQNSIRTTYLHTIVALVKLQGLFGIPKLLAYQCYEKGYAHRYLLDTSDFTEWPQPMIPLKAMIAQYISAVIEYHKEYVSLGLGIQIRWQNQQIKFIRWEACGFRGDCDNYKQIARPADSFIDMQTIGSTIVEWSKKMQSEEFLPLAKALKHPCPFRRLSPEFALKVLDEPHLLTQAAISQYTLDMARQWCDEYELNEVVECRLKETAKKKRKLKRRIEWLENITPIVQRGRVITKHGNEFKIIGKTLKTYHGGGASELWSVALEFSVAQWLSGKKYLPRLLDFAIGIVDNEISHVLLIFPQYNSEPKQRDIMRTAKQLLMAVKTIHEKRVIHCDIAPPNVMWDDNDDLVLIDFGSTFWFNHFDALNDWVSAAQSRPYGHPGFMPGEQARYPVTDVFSAGRTIEYFAKEWNQMTPELQGLIQAMTLWDWYKRISLDEALDRLEQIANECQNIKHVL